MTSVPIQIFMHGLIALVPNNTPDGANHMTALLVDARHPSQEMTCVVAHTPQIQFPTSAQECTNVDACEIDGEGTCLCTLDRQEISILPDAEPSKAQLAKSPARVLPFDTQDAGDFAYVGNLAQVRSTPQSHYTLNKAFLPPSTPSDPPTAPPGALVARFRFPFNSVRACNLSTRRDDGADYVHPLSFRPVGTEERGDEMIQALAQIFVANVEIPVDTAGGQALKLRLSPFPGEAGTTYEFTLPVNPTGLAIQLTNSRPHMMAPDDPCDDGVARDFAYFYDLVQNPPEWAARPVPHIKYSQSKSFADLDSDECKKKKYPMSRPICPMGSFNENVEVLP
jgi:hypothetical protein